MNLIKTSCIKIPLHCEGEPWCQDILKDLTRIGSDYNDPTVKITTHYYEKKDGFIMIPRFYEVQRYGHKVVDYTPEGDDINIKFNSSWRNELQLSGFNMLTQYNHGILKLPPGEGKTVVSIGAICHVGKKSIVFVHKDSLISQWKERFIQHSNIKADDIGILKTDKCRDVFKKPIVLSTVQTLVSMLERVDNIEQVLLDAKFGFAIWDECHTTTGAPQYSRTSMHIPCRRTFGLSATPGRPDQNHDVIGMHLGGVYAPDGESKTMKPKIMMLYFSHGADYAKQYVYWGARDKNGNAKEKWARFDTTRYLSILTSKKNTKYIPMMRKIARKVYMSDRITLLISDRIKVLDAIVAGKNIPKHDAGFFIPRSKDKRDSELLKKFVLSTPGSSRDGTDRQEFNCLIMANCISNIPQAAGRVCRFMVNKLQPVIFDCVDTDFEELIERAEGRKKIYAENGWEVEEKFLK